jgi:hypothetical protein
VNSRPKTSVLGSLGVLGEVVLVICSLAGLMSGRWAMEEEADLGSMLYHLAACLALRGSN